MRIFSSLRYETTVGGLGGGLDSWFRVEMTKTSVSNSTLFHGHTHELIRKSPAQHP